ncbi:MAG TPA: DUF502 domain-containing protein [Beijerinckiaceae bacterium]|nr:DUF502 domain-containing protein [Beijerinckiaceae bacterium]
MTADVRTLHPDPNGAGLSRSARLRGYFLTGLVVAGPLAITVWLSWWFINMIDGWVKPFVPRTFWPETYLPFPIPGFGVIILLFALTMLGFLTANLVGRTMLDLGENLLNRMPVVRGIYKSAKQIFETIFSQSGTSFRRVGLIEYPGPGLWSIVFISSPPTGDIAAKLPGGPDDQIGVFLPCAPNPTTGFFFYVARSQLREIQTSVDDAFKIVLSLGLLKDESQQEKLRDLAAQSKMVT